MPKEAGNLQVKFRCACGHRLLAPLCNTGRSARCPGCEAEVVVPGVAAENVIALVCGCGEEIPAGRELCPSCAPAPGADAEEAPTGELDFGRTPASWLPAVLGAMAVLVAGSATLAVVLGRAPAPRPVSPAAPAPVARVFTPDPPAALPETGPEPGDPPGAAPKTDPPEPPPAKPPDPPPRRPDPPPSKKPPATPPKPPAELPFDVATRTALPPRPELPPRAAADSRPPSEATFSEKILPILDAACMSCHGKAGLPVGGFTLTLPGKSGHGAISRKKNFDAVVRFTRPDAPERSPLVLKPLALADGGSEHGGGDNFRKDSLEYAALVAFASGAAPAEVRPFADAGPDQEVDTGRVARFDGVKSREPGGRRLKWEWRVAVAPPGSTAEIRNADGREATLTPDVAGTWLIELVVVDPSKGRSLPARVRLRARSPAAGGPPAPSPARGTRIKALVGRAFGLEADPAATERLAALAPAGVADDILADADFWRVLLARDLGHLDMTGPFLPEGVDLAADSVAWANGAGDLAATWSRWLADGPAQRRFPDPASAATALLARVAGRRPEDPAAPPSVKGLGPELVRSDAFGRLWLERQHRALAGTAPAAADLARWAAAWKADPAALRAILREWLVRAAQ